jgi:hypothetical protein
VLEIYLAQLLQNSLCMRKILKNVDVFFVATLLLASAVSFSTSHYLNRDDAARRPSAADNTYELHIQSLSLDAASRIPNQSKVFVRATFNQKYEMELGKSQSWSLHKGDLLPVDVKIDVNDAWVKNDNLEFKLELVKDEGFKNTIIRCAIIAKELSVYNRGYTCSVPGEKAPIISYRLSKKGAPLPNENNIAFQSSK